MKNFINKVLKPMNIEIHGKGYLQALAKGDFKKDEFDFQKDFLRGRKVPCIFDVGANVGYIAQRYFSIFPNAVIHAFEPFPDSFATLKSNFKDSSNIILNEVAIGEIQTTREFFVNTNPDTNSLLAPQKTGLSSDTQCKNVRSIDVEVETIDNYCRKNNITSIDILKLDIQGGELNALKGGLRMLQSKKIDIIYTEAYFVQQYRDQPRFNDISTFLFSNGYRLQDIYNPIYGNNSLAWCDAIFIRNEVSS